MYSFLQKEHLGKGTFPNSLDDALQMPFLLHFVIVLKGKLILSFAKGAFGKGLTPKIHKSPKMPILLCIEIMPVGKCVLTFRKRGILEGLPSNLQEEAIKHPFSCSLHCSTGTLVHNFVNGAFGKGLPPEHTGASTKDVSCLARWHNSNGQANFAKGDLERALPFKSLEQSLKMFILLHFVIVPIDKLILIFEKKVH